MSEHPALNWQADRTRVDVRSSENEPCMFKSTLEIASFR